MFYAFISFKSYPIHFFIKDMLPDDGERDWPENELFSYNPWLLDGCHLGQAAASSYFQDLAQILSLSVNLHDLPVSAVCGHTACSLSR